MLQKTYSQLNIIDEGDMEDFDDDIEVGDFEIDDNISNFGGAGANGGNRCIGGRWELKRRKQQLIKYSLRKSFRELHNHLSQKEDINSITSGGTLTAVLFGEDGFLYTAAVGDSRAVL